MEWFAGKAANRNGFKFGRNFRLTVGLLETLILPDFGGGKSHWPAEIVVCPLLLLSPIIIDVLTGSIAAFDFKISE
ncbi:MAG: hypothetical protein Q8N89_10605 [Azonexus sp.]|nr:hypothetical protein [Azonexus sp.]